MTATQAPVKHDRIVVVDAFSIRALSATQLMALAAVHPEGTTDPLDLALADKVKREAPDLFISAIEPGELDPARPDRRYSLARVRDFHGSENAIRDLMVMRGDLESVLGAIPTTHEERTTIRRQAQMIRMRGARPLAVASARIAEDGTMGPYRLQGFVAVRHIVASDDFSEDAAARPGEWMRINVWSPLLRFEHWINVAVIFILSCTGYYIMDPFFGPMDHDGIPTGYLMGWMREIHFVTAFLWIAIGLTRVILAFVSRDRYMRWPTFFPLKKKEDWKNLGRTAGYYMFLRKEAPLYLAHNPLQQLTYTGIYGLGLFQMISGMSLYGLYHQSNPFWAWMAGPAHWMGVPGLRLLHACIMFLFWAFVIAHVYLAVRADSIERHGGVSSMVNGGVWMRRGSKPVDAPEVG